MHTRPSLAVRILSYNLLFVAISLAGCSSSNQPKSNPGGTSPSSPSANPPSGTTKALSSVAVSPTSVSVAVGASQQFTAIAKYSDGSTADATATSSWKSSNSSIATVSASGLAKGLAAGTASITATLQGISGSAAVTVQAGSGGGGSSSTGSTDLLYASKQVDSLVIGWLFNEVATSPTLTTTPGSPYASGPGPTQLALSPDGKFLYGLAQQTMPTVRGSNCYDYPNELDAWSIDHSSGALTLVQQLTLHEHCGYMAMDPAGKFLYVTETSATDSSGYIEVAGVDAASGKMTLTAGSPYKFAQAPLFPAVAGNLLYAVQWGSGSSPGLLVFQRDTTTGDVRYLGSQSPAGQAMQDLDRLAVSPSGGTLYLLSYQTGAITTYAVNATTGNLTQENTAATATNGFSVATDPTGNYVAVAGANGVYLFTVQGGGGLTRVAGSPFGSEAVSVKFDASGQHLAVVSINSATGNRVVDVYSLSATAVRKEASSAEDSYLSDVVMLAK